MPTIPQLGLQTPDQFIIRHGAVSSFIAEKQPDSSSAEHELDAFIELRNEAAHTKVENLLAVDAIGNIGRFLVALGNALADMVSDAVIRRHIESKKYAPFMQISNTYGDRSIVVGIPGAGLRIRVGHEVVVLRGDGAYQMALVEEIQLNDAPSNEALGDGTTEVGIRLNVRSSQNAQILVCRVPSLGLAQPPVLTELVPPRIESEPDTEAAEITFGTASHDLDDDESGAAGDTADQ